MRKLYLYPIFERLWHCLQALLIIGQWLSGFTIHGTWHITSFEQAYEWHVRFGWALLVLYILAIFWMLTTGSWRQFVPTFQRFKDVALFYMSGIFKGEEHPWHEYKLQDPRTNKFNPLQRFTYLGIVIFMVPFMIVTGLLLIYYNRWPEWGLNWSLEPMAVLHTLGAFLLLAFFIGHVYLTTTGRTILTYPKSIILGYEEEEEAHA